MQNPCAKQPALAHREWHVQDMGILDLAVRLPLAVHRDQRNDVAALGHPLQPWQKSRAGAHQAVRIKHNPWACHVSPWPCITRAMFLTATYWFHSMLIAYLDGS